MRTHLELLEGGELLDAACCTGSPATSGMCVTTCGIRIAHSASWGKVILRVQCRGSREGGGGNRGGGHPVGGKRQQGTPAEEKGGMSCKGSGEGGKGLGWQGE